MGFVKQKQDIKSITKFKENERSINQ